MAVMVVLLPVPGQLTKLVQSAKQKMMKETDERVQVVSDSTFIASSLPLSSGSDAFLYSAMSSLRMIKLFGWEAKLHDRIAGKRTKELKWLRRGRYFEALLEFTKYNGESTLALARTDL